MKLIHFQGLNCYHDCLVTIANAFGIDYIKGFSRLWSERNFRYDPICGVFVTQRMPKMLESMGMKLKSPCTSKDDRETGWANTLNDEFVIVGMDAYLIPWNPVYQLQHGPHYFMVQKRNMSSQICFDPTYGLSNQKMSSDALISNSYNIIPIQKTQVFTSLVYEKNLLLAQAREVINTHAETLQFFLQKANGWIHSTTESALLPAKFVDALITGRYLYRHFLKERHILKKREFLFECKHYYQEWETVKNGFYKAALIKKNQDAFNEACSRLTSLIEEEITFAKDIIVLKE